MQITKKWLCAPGLRCPQSEARQRSFLVSELLQRRPNRDVELADALDLALDLVTGDGGGDARRRTRHNDVAGCELDHLRQFRDDFRHVPDHLIEVAVLTHLAVDLERDAALRRMSDLGSRLERAAGRGVVERLTDFPRP